MEEREIWWDRKDEKNSDGGGRKKWRSRRFGGGGRNEWRIKNVVEEENEMSGKQEI